MLKTQIIAVIVAIVVIILLLNLPKVIINQTNKDKLVDNPRSKSQLNSPKGAFSNTLRKEDINLLQNLRKNFSTATDIEKKSIFADSLAKSFVKFQKFDSAAYYAEQIVLSNSTVNNTQKCADVYFSMFNLSSDTEEAINYASKARSYYLKVVALDSNNLDANNNLAMTYSVSDTPMEAVIILRKVLQKDENNQNAIFNLGLLSIKSGQLDKAAQRFASLLEMNKKNWKALFYLGLVYKEQNKNNEANKAFEEIIKNANDLAIVAEAKQNLIQLKN